MSDDPVQIVRFWQAVEIFSPQQLPNPSANDNVRDIRPRMKMPWEQRRAADAGKVWRHEVYCGVYDLERVRDVLVQHFGDDDTETTVKGQSAIFACTVDADGHIVDGSAIISACAWATGQVLHGKSPFGNFEQDAVAYADQIGKLADSRLKAGMRALAAALRDAVPDAVTRVVAAVVTSVLAPFGGPLAAGGGALAAGGGALAGGAAGSLAKSAMKGDSLTTNSATAHPVQLDAAAISGDDLQDFTAELASRLGVADDLEPANVRVRSYQISLARAEEEAGQPFLNSFFTNDLANVATAIGERDIGTALTRFLVPEPHPQRVDVQEKPQSVLHGCGPERLPQGRWVTGQGQPLAFSQQFAVNQALRDLGDGAGVFPVNGPPGTGKTTMLRDIIAAIVVNRAIELACLDSPAEAFTGKAHPWSTAKFSHQIKVPASQLTGFEIVVASSNNGAVENVTSQIPGPDGIDTQWEKAAEEVDYFTGTARQVHGDGAWAMIAARLGNFANRSEFTEHFWWDKDGSSMSTVLSGTTPPQWRTAVTNFRHALAEVRTLSTERRMADQAIHHLPSLEQEHARGTNALTIAMTRHADLGARLRETERELEDARKTRLDTSEALRLHTPGKPGSLAFLSGRRRAARDAWEQEHRELDRQFMAANQNYRDLSKDASTLRSKVETAASEVQTAQTRLDALGSETLQAKAAVLDATRRWGDHVPTGPEYAPQTRARDLVETREKSAPWADEKFTAARTKLFLAALALHKALILDEAPTFRKNLNALMDVIGGKGRPADPTLTLALWQTFFLVVPVVSSTFASFGRLFAGCGREALGWLLIDEAGQAPPQYAAGALWRSRRCVVVGDPQQLEPVVTLPWDGQRALLRHFGVSEQWAPSRTSVQQVADQLAVYGTPLPARTPGEQVWVGTPLRVHRRCDRPMFDVSNAIAYNGLMVFGTPARDPFHSHDAWYDVRSAAAEGHWIPAEGEVLLATLTRLRWAGVQPSEIRILSPFRKVAREAAKTHREVFRGIAAEDRKKWVGTVHTMQGKEADVVILVLGGDPENPGARRFATEYPNLLNVAVSRARRRLYVIGDRSAWTSTRFFKTLAEHVPAESPPVARSCEVLAGNEWRDGLILKWERGQDDRWKGTVEYRDGARIVLETRDQDDLRRASPSPD